MKYQEILEGLTIEGMTPFYFGNQLKTEGNPLRHEVVEKVRMVVRNHFDQARNINKDLTSYRLKHMMERFLDTYVANGEMIAALVLEGYDIQRSGQSQNAFVNVSKESVKQFYRVLNGIR